MSPGFLRWAPRPLERRWVPGWARDPVRASDVLGSVCWGFWERQADCPAVDSKVKAMPWRTGQRIGSVGTWPGCWIEPPLSRTCTWRAESSHVRQFESVFSFLSQHANSGHRHHYWDYCFTRDKKDINMYVFYQS